MLAEAAGCKEMVDALGVEKGRKLGKTSSVGMHRGTTGIEIDSPANFGVVGAED